LGHGAPIKRIELPPLALCDGADLLRRLGVKGEDEELKATVREYGGHALSLAILGTYLVEKFGGNARERFKTRPLTDASGSRGVPQDQILLKGEERAVFFARNMIASYEKWFEEQSDPIAQTALAILRVLGLFDRPAEQAWLSVLRQHQIRGLTEPFFATSEPEETWRKAIIRLRRAKLISGSPDSLAAHPLICQYFTDQLRDQFPDAARRAQSLLFDHLKSQGPSEPTVLEELEPLYRAVYHGCRAGRCSDAFELFWKHIVREERSLSTGKFGAFSRDLEALAHFFVDHWKTLVPGLERPVQAEIKMAVGFRLRTVGYLKEAKTLLCEALTYWKGQASAGGREKASKTANLLSVLSVHQGTLSEAVNYARAGVQQADKMPEDSADLRKKKLRQQMARGATLGHALLQVGRRKAAEDVLKDAERIQRQIEPRRYLLYSTKGFRYLDLLLDKEDYRAVLSRVRKIKNWVTEAYQTLDPALYKLCEGLARLIQDQHSTPQKIEEATGTLEEALDLLREAGFAENIIRGLLALAKAYRLSERFDDAKACLKEAQIIAGRAKMKLLRADCFLERAWLYLAQQQRAKAQRALAKAKAMVDEMGYGRRRQEVRKLERTLATITQNPDVGVAKASTLSQRAR
jgi:tetratricopeptide (TPR) repeat protein